MSIIFMKTEPGFMKNLAAHSRDFSHELAASLNSLFQ